ncbi:MAG: response regulator [Lachnospiraceae bacterium]|nr:response regulator [Lachnospiraceae bacterium]
MSEESMVNISKLPYSEAELNADKFRIIKDYDGSIKLLYAINNNVTGFGVYVVSDIWSVYGKAFIYGLICLIVFTTCIILVDKTISNMIKWQDATNAKLKEAKDVAIAAGHAKGQFLAQMSHEIRTPINAVLGMNELILRETNDDNIREYSTNLEASGRTLLSLINDILDFSKIEDGKLEIIPVKYNVSAVAFDLVNSIAERAKAKGLELIVNIDKNMPSEFFGDEIRIKQVIMNILTNAVKYTEKGSVTFSATFDKIEEEGADVVVHISVKDTGIGIKPEDMKKLFSEFERIEEDRNRNIEGTGLGMAITKSLLEMMGSSLKVESTYGEGSNFYFDLKHPVVNWEPVGDYKEAYQNIAKGRDEYKEQFTAPDAHVLVVDDNAMNLKVFVGLVKKTKVKVDTAESGDAGLSLMKDKKYDIIFLDHMMPNKDGIETLKELKDDKDNVNNDVPVICLTANAISGAREEYIKAGFNDYLTKPIKPKELEDTLMKYLPQDMIN